MNVEENWLEACQFIFSRNAVRVASGVKMHILPEALVWLWQDYWPMAKYIASGGE